MRSLLVVLLVSSSLAWQLPHAARLAAPQSARPRAARPAAPTRRPAARHSSPAMLSAAEAIDAGVSLTTFAPQPFWLLMLAAPRSELTRKVMSGLGPILGLSAVHLAIVLLAATSPGGTEPVLIFADVFDPAQSQLAGMQRLFEVRDFVAEEWPHVLIWDLLAGRAIWLDGLARGVYTVPSLLLTNLIGPPGLLLHAAVSLASGKGLPQLGGADGAVGGADDGGGGDGAGRARAPRMGAPAASSGAVLRTLFGGAVDPAAVAAACAADVVWEDLSLRLPCEGRDAVAEHISSRWPPGSRLVLERVSDGVRSGGATWHRESDAAPGAVGLRGTIYLELDGSGAIAYVREAAEPLFKPGAATEALLKAVTKGAAKPDAPPTYTRATPKGASAVAAYLWREAYPNGAPAGEALRFFSDAIRYEDFNYAQPFVGIEAVTSFIEAFDIPGIDFVPLRISEGERGCAFTWKVLINGAEGPQGLSYYEAAADGKVCFVRDIPAPSIKPPPLGSLAAAVDPQLRVFAPRARE